MMYQSCHIFYPAMTMVRAAINQFMHPMSVVYIPFPFHQTRDTTLSIISPSTIHFHPSTDPRLDIL